MTAKEFVAWAQGYYGPYPEGQKRDIGDYLCNLSPAYRDALKATLLKRYSAKWGHAPDIAIFEEVRREALDSTKYDVPQITDARPDATPDEVAATMQEIRRLFDTRQVREGARG